MIKYQNAILIQPHRLHKLIRRINSCYYCYCNVFVWIEKVVPRVTYGGHYRRKDTNKSFLYWHDCFVCYFSWSQKTQTLNIKTLQQNGFIWWMWVINMAAMGNNNSLNIRQRKSMRRTYLSNKNPNEPFLTFLHIPLNVYAKKVD